MTEVWREWLAHLAKEALMVFLVHEAYLGLQGRVVNNWKDLENQMELTPGNSADHVIRATRDKKYALLLLVFCCANMYVIKRSYCFKK